MKILVVGDAGSIFIKQYIEFVLDNPQNEVVLLLEAYVCEDYLRYYQEAGIKVEPFENAHTGIWCKIPKIRSSLGCWLWCRYIAQKYGHFDLVHVHGLNVNRGNIGHYMRKSTRKLAISVWGDEIFRKNEKQLMEYRKYYDEADYITLSTQAMRKRFIATYGHRYDSCVCMNKFAVGILDKIDGCKENQDRQTLCKEFGITGYEKKLVFVGHNGRSAQRHFELTDQVSKLSQEDKDQIVLVYTMSYGVCNDRYLKQTKQLAEQSGCEYVIIESFLNEDRVAKLRSICDVMLHAQLTDAFSASICESLYAGAVVINGSWLVYDDLPDCHSRFVEYDSIEEIPRILTNVLHHFDKYRDLGLQNKQIIRSICSREITTQRWKESLQIEN